MPISYGETKAIAPAGAIVTREKIVAMMKGRFFDFKGELTAFQANASEVVVKDDDSLAAAVDLQGQIKQLMAKVENRRKDVTAPLLEDKREVDGFAQGIRGQCAEIIATLKSVIDPYLYQKERERKEAERVQRERLEADRKKTLAQHAAAAKAASDAATANAALKIKSESVKGDGIKPDDEKTNGGILAVGKFTHTPDPVIPEIVPDETKVETASGSVTVKSETVPEIVNLAEAVTDPGFIRARAKWIEEQLLIYARQCIKMGKVNLPGVVFRDVPVTRSRMKR